MVQYKRAPIHVSVQGVVVVTCGYIILIMVPVRVPDTYQTVILFSRVNLSKE